MDRSERADQGKSHLLESVLRTCRAWRRREKFVDSTGARLTGGELLARALALRRILRRGILEPDERNIGVLLPPTVAGVVANLTLALDRRVAVNLNYTFSNEMLDECIREAGIKTVLTSRRVLERLNIELEADLVFLEDLRTKATKRDQIVAGIEAFAMPLRVLRRHLKLDEIGPDDLLTILFTSGSTGDPKGVMLTYRNISSNTEMMKRAVNLQDDDVLVAVLPFFHAFGLTVTLWMPLAYDAKAVYHTSPLEADVIARLTREEKGTILLATPTFLRLYLARIDPADFASLNFVAAGAEHLPIDLIDQFHARFGIRPISGYGATEASPAIAANIPPSRWLEPGANYYREGTVGRPLPGVRTRVTDRETGEELGPNREGLLWVTGPNIMRGYLNRPELTGRVIRDGWYNTGDVVIIDEEGFITITGRESQFSKIAGETVPHLLIEETIAQILAPHGGQDIVMAAVTAVPHVTRGERVVVLHTPLPIPVSDVRHQLSERGLPPLFIPAEDSFVEVEELPLLGTGKVDLRRLRLMAHQAFDERGGRLPSTGLPRRKRAEPEQVSSS